MPVSNPPQLAVKEFLGATTRHTRRVEIYEADGVTRWTKDKVPRIKDGTVTVDYDRDERRALDLTLDNTDGVLLNAPGEFWYDKVIKVFRGTRVDEPVRTPRILVLTDKTGADTMAGSFRETIVTLGFGDVQINTSATSWAELADFDVIVGLGAATPVQVDLLKQAYMSGKSVYVQDVDAGAWINATYPGTSAVLVSSYAVMPREVSTHPSSKGWMQFTQTKQVAMNSFVPTTPDFSSVASYGQTMSSSKVLAFEEPVRGGRAMALSFSMNFDQYDVPQFVNMLASIFLWLNTVKPITHWETQIGEFMVDRISESSFPHDMKITGRDYTKKCMGSKFTEATQFTTGLALESIIATIAGAAGIIKRSLPGSGVAVNRTFFFDRGVSRWEAMKEITNAYDYELFFDAMGYLTMRPYRDPVTTSPTLFVETGREGQLASYTKTTSDARIYNSIVVTGESSDSSTINVYGKAKNEDPNSPTSILKIGERVYQYSSSFITTFAQAQQVADNFLAVHALEEFELSFESLMLPWLEVGDILGWKDPNPAPGDPSTFLLATISIPLSLGPMSASARRVTNVS